ncbi:MULTISPECIES: helix-turn-helix transcriptional regulator [Oscillospiraceae]|uniref:Helix-turn-helix domain protein n=1 Tax=Pseudobacteroides cellulosolvens ATCC 35603 = DSM 2933 TaxID=398512 RepID=A0A0L6JTM8_9FIRM|nr:MULTISPECIES: helix-turn-helix transcriptional regulator [Oscillospiraceae]KNY29079.1 helix-turn-helix domain protein [Pseudobacteroides cellulosolvens ATCC 35603 = DSM 2933]
MSKCEDQVLAKRIGAKIRGIRGNLSREEFVEAIDRIVTPQSLYRVEKGLRKASDKVLQKISEKFNKPLSWFYEPDCETEAIQAEFSRLKILEAIQNDPSLLEFFEKLSQRSDLKIMFKQVKDLSPESIKRLIRIIRAIEDEEDENPT